MNVTINVNGALHESPAAPDTPLLYVLRNDLQLNSAKFGCGAAMCGACTVLLDGQAVRSCVYPVGSVGDSKVVTLEGLGSPERLHALQRAFMEEQAAQCGYCISGMIMSAHDLLTRVPNPEDAEIREYMAGNLCRCGTHTRIIRAIKRAAKELG